MPHPMGPMPANFVRAHRMFPLVGAAIGGAVGLLFLGIGRSVCRPRRGGACLGAVRS